MVISLSFVISGNCACIITFWILCHHMYSSLIMFAQFLLITNQQSKSSPISVWTPPCAESKISLDLLLTQFYFSNRWSKQLLSNTNVVDLFFLYNFCFGQNPNLSAKFWVFGYQNWVKFRWKGVKKKSPPASVRHPWPLDTRQAPPRWCPVPTTCPWRPHPYPQLSCSVSTLSCARPSLLPPRIEPSRGVAVGAPATPVAPPSDPARLRPPYLVLYLRPLFP